jgi:deoxyadenosine/deoxycytidine kinase
MSQPILQYPYLVVEGNIGAGKTSLAKILSNLFNTSLVLEAFADNTFLPQFYENPERFAFPLEMSFLAERFQQINQAQELALAGNQPLIGDYIFEKSLLFAKVTLKGAELELFSRFYSLINPALRPPDLILYLHKSTDVLLKNIAKRGREYEKNIPADYLENISQQYLEHLKSIDNQRIIILDTDKLDFVNDPAHLRIILEILESAPEPKVHEISL